MQILFDNWQKAKRNSKSAYNKWQEKRTELSRYGNRPTPYQLVKQVKAYHKRYDNLKKEAKDAEILYLRCKNTEDKPVYELLSVSISDLEIPPELE